MKISRLLAGLLALFGGLIALLIVAAARVVPEHAPHPVLGLDFQGGIRLVFVLDVPGDVDFDMAQTQAVHVIRERLEGFGADSVVRARGDSIVVEVAGNDAEFFSQLRSLIASNAQLEFMSVADEEAQFLYELRALPEGVERTVESVGYPEAIGTPLLSATGPGAEARLRSCIEGIEAPDGLTLAFSEEVDFEGVATVRTYVVRTEPRLTGEDVVDAHVGTDDDTQLIGTCTRGVVFEQRIARGEQTVVTVRTVRSLLGDDHGLLALR